MRKTGTVDKIIHQYAVSKEHTEQPSNIDVSIVTVAPISFVFAVGYVIGIFVLLIKLSARGNILKYWPRGTVRLPWLN